jgi:hypothetical protein
MCDGHLTFDYFVSHREYQPQMSHIGPFTGGLKRMVNSPKNMVYKKSACRFVYMSVSRKPAFLSAVFQM